MTVTTIDSLPSQAELQFLLTSARMPTQDRAAELTHQVSAALAASLTTAAATVLGWDLLQLIPS